MRDTEERRETRADELGCFCSARFALEEPQENPGDYLCNAVGKYFFVLREGEKRWM